MTEIHITEPRYPPQGHRAGIPSITHFRTAGELVGEAALITHAATRCLTRTAAIPCAARYFTALLKRRLPQTRHVLLCSLEDRTRSDEAVYAMAIRPPSERVSRPLAHVADTAGIPDPDTAAHTVITGPGQEDVAAALQLAVSPRTPCAPCATSSGPDTTPDASFPVRARHTGIGPPGPTSLPDAAQPAHFCTESAPPSLGTDPDTMIITMLAIGTGAGTLAVTTVAALSAGILGTYTVLHHQQVSAWMRSIRRTDQSNAELDKPDQWLADPYKAQCRLAHKPCCAEDFEDVAQIGTMLCGVADHTPEIAPELARVLERIEEYTETALPDPGPALR